MERRLIVTISLVCLLAASCTAKNAGDREAAEVPRPPEVQQPKGPARHSGEIRLPDRLRFPSVEYVSEAQSWNARLDRLAASERARLETLNARYYGMLEFNSPDEQRKLIEAGFPMPEEWLAADAMTDQQLAKLAKSQSPKGSLFYANREFDRFTAAKQAMLDAGNYNDLDRSVARPKVEAMIYSANALALTRSPFAAYLYGSVHARMFGRAEYTAAAIAVARALGDQRADMLARQYTERSRWSKDPPVEFSSLTAAETLMWMEVHRYRPL